MNMIYIFWTCRDKIEAKKIIHALLEKRLIACASIFPEIESIYRWEGKIEEAKEVKVILKTQARLFKAIQNYIEAHCSYEVPEIVQVNITEGSSKYLAWIVKETDSIDARELEDQLLADKAYAVLQRLESGEEKTIPWKKHSREKP